jgi:HlyD family secretion protein
MKKIQIIFLVLAIVLSGALAWRLSYLKRQSEGPAGGTGTIEGVEVNITARISARIRAVLVREGDGVKKDQVLVELDCTESEAMLAQAKSQWAAAQFTVEAARLAAEAAAANAQAARRVAEATGSKTKTLETGRNSAQREANRLQSLKNAGAIADSSMDRAKDQVESINHQIEGVMSSQQAARSQADAAKLSGQAAASQVQSAENMAEAAKAAVSRAEALVKECRLTAPRDGVVLSRNFEPGEAVLPGNNILTLVDTREAKVTFFLPNAELAAAAPGKKVTVRADAYPNATFQGTILHVSPEAEFTPRNVQTREDRDRLVYGVEVSIDNPEGKLRSGMPVEVSIDGTEK